MNRPGGSLRVQGMSLLHLLVVVPLVTDIVETGRLPDSPREWFTEAVAGAVIAALVRRVRNEHAQVLALARTDPLTGLWNRRSFEEAVADECARARRSGQPLSLVYVDVDHFKAVNDRLGHARGDQVLRQVAEAIGQAIRIRVDRGFRLGGDEFALLLPGSTARQSEAVVGRIREACGGADEAWSDPGIGLGLSAGIVEFAAGEGPDELVRRADTAMYRQKQAARRPPSQALRA